MRDAILLGAIFWGALYVADKMSATYISPLIEFSVRHFVELKIKPQN